jgi:hypothetical protein
MLPLRHYGLSKYQSLVFQGAKASIRPPLYQAHAPLTTPFHTHAFFTTSAGVYSSTVMGGGPLGRIVSGTVAALGAATYGPFRAVSLEGTKESIKPLRSSNQGSSESSVVYFPSAFSVKCSPKSEGKITRFFRRVWTYVSAKDGLRILGAGTFLF